MQLCRSQAAPGTDPPVLHLQESPVCHLGILGAFFFSLKEGPGTGCPGFPISGSAQEVSGCDFGVRMVVLGWPLDLLISSSLCWLCGVHGAGTGGSISHLVLLTLPSGNCSGKFEIHSHLV